MTPFQISELLVSGFTGASLVWAGLKGSVSIAMILKEVSPNGGASLKDRVLKLEGNDSEKFRRLQSIETKVDTLSESVSRIEGAVASVKTDTTAQDVRMKNADEDFGHQ